MRQILGCAAKLDTWRPAPAHDCWPFAPESLHSHRWPLSRMTIAPGDDAAAHAVRPVAAAARALPRAPWRRARRGSARLSARPEPRAAARRRDHRGSGAGAGRRRHRQDARADHPHRPYPGHRPRLAEPDPRRHLHQQGGARDEAAHRPAGRRGGRGHAVARHLPLDRRQAAAPPRRARRPAIRLHHSRHRRPGPADQAAHPGRGAGRQALAGAPVRADDRRLEEQGPRPRRDSRRRRPRLRQRQGPRALQGLSGPAEDAERLRFRRSALPPDPHLPRPPRRARGVSPRFKYILVDEYQDTNTAQYMWLRLLAQRPRRHSSPSRGRPRHGRGWCHASAITPIRAADDPAPRGATALPAEGRKPDRASAGQAAPAEASERSARSAASENRVNICCVGDDDQSIYGWRGAEVDNILRFDKDFPGATVIRLERNYRSTAHILGAASHLIAHNEGRLGKTLFTDRADPDDAKVNVHAAWDSEEEARAVGETIEQHQRKGHLSERHGDPGARLLPDARVRGPLRHARPELPRHRRPALLRAPGNPRRPGLSARRRPARRRPRLRAHRQRAEARPWRGRDPPDPRHRARARHPDAGGGRKARRKRRAEAEAARRAARGRRQFRAAGRSCWRPRRTPSSPRSSWRSPATRRCGRTTARPKRPAGWKTSRSSSAPWRNTNRCAPSSSMSRWSWTPSRTRSSTPSRS